MKYFVGFMLLVIAIGIWGGEIFADISSSYAYQRDVGSYWELADKSSSIPAKAAYVDKFVSALEQQHLEGVNNAIFMFTPDNSFDFNFQALQTLQTRLHEIGKMDVNSFQYQTAIHQITEQEMNQANPMLQVFEGAYYKQNYHMIWGPWGWFWACVGFLFLGCSIVAFAVAAGND